MLNLFKKKEVKPETLLSKLRMIGSSSLCYFLNSIETHLERIDKDMTDIVLHHENNYVVMDNNIQEIIIITEGFSQSVNDPVKFFKKYLQDKIRSEVKKLIDGVLARKDEAKVFFIKPYADYTPYLSEDIHDPHTGIPLKIVYGTHFGNFDKSGNQVYTILILINFILVK